MNDFAYFDNAATSFPKPEEVYRYADETYRRQGVSIGRGNYELSKSAGNIAEQSKMLLKELLGCEGKQVVYTPSATEAINRILLGLQMREGDTVYITPFEHNAVTRTLYHLQAYMGINLKLLPFDQKTLLLNKQEMLRDFEEDPPKVVAITHASNVCGAVIPVEEIMEAAKRYECVTMVDMSQTAGILPLQLSRSSIDFAVFAGHKTLFAPFGIGGFICSNGEDRLAPILFGGNGVNSIEQEMPADIIQMEEIGSQNIYAIAGLLASTKWLIKHIDEVSKKEEERKQQLLALLRGYSNIRIVADDMQCPRIGVVSCLFDGYSPDEIGNVLSELNVAVRTGLHCSPFAHKFLGTLPAGTVRFSTSPLTNDDSFEMLKSALDYIRDNS